MKRGSGRMKTEAKAKLKAILRDYEDGLAIAPTDYTVGGAVRDWLEHGLNDRDARPARTTSVCARSTCYRSSAFLGVPRRSSAFLGVPRRSSAFLAFVGFGT